MVNGNLLKRDGKFSDFRRFKVYYDNKPPTAADAEKRVCLALKSSGQVIRLSEIEAYDLMSELTKALKWGHSRRHH
jgi:hypothetical protein